MPTDISSSEKIEVRFTVKAYGITIGAKVPVDLTISQILPALLHKLGLPQSAARYGLEHEESGICLSETATLGSAGVRNGDSLRLISALVVRVPLEEPSEKVQVRITDQAGGKTVNAKLPASVPTRQLLTALIVKMGLPSGTAYFMVHKESGRKLNDADTLYSAGVCHGDTMRLVPDIIV